MFFFYVVGLVFRGKLIEGELSEEFYRKDIDLFWKVRFVNYLV